MSLTLTAATENSTTTMLEAFRAELGQDEGNEADRSYWRFTISAGQHSARATIEWADETLAELDAMTASTTRTEQ